jgi:hypothetical protein
MRPEAAISLAMLALYEERGHSDVGLREDIIEKVRVLRARHVPVAGVKLRPGMSGEYSDEVSDFVGRLVIAGFVVQESPIKLTSKGLALIKHHLSESMRDPEVAKGAAALGLERGFLELEGGALAASHDG